jgi:beta-xylosidase
MQLKPILLLMLPHWMMISANKLDGVIAWMKQEHPNCHVLVMTSTEIEEIVMELSSWRALSYENYATLVKMVDREAWEALEDWRMMELFGGQEHLYLDNP